MSAFKPCKVTWDKATCVPEEEMKERIKAALKTSSVAF